MPMSVDDHDSIHRGFDDRAPARFAASQGLLDPLGVRNVSRDCGGAHNQAGRVLDRRHGERHIEHSAVLRQSSSLEVCNTLVGPDAVEDLVQFMPLIRWNQERGWTTDRFACGIAVQPLGTPIPTQDHAVEVLGDDGVVEGLDNRRENEAVII